MVQIMTFRVCLRSWTWKKLEPSGNIPAARLGSRVLQKDAKLLEVP